MRFTSAALAAALAVVTSTTCPSDAFFVPRAFAPQRRRTSTEVYSSTRKKDEEAIRRALHNSVAKGQELTEFLQKSSSGRTRSSAAATSDEAQVEAAQSSARRYLRRFVGQSGAAACYTKLVDHQVTVVNGFSGGAVLPLLDQFHPTHPRHLEPDAPQPIRWITNSNEASAGHIAEGYAKSMPTGDPHNLPVAVAIATSGPGVTNLITPLQDAICDGVPIVVMCGQAATVAPKDAFQSSPAVELTTPCTKWSYQIKSAAEIPFAMDYAMYVARNGRPGPVFLDLPKDLQNQIITDELVQEFVSQSLDGNDDDPDSLAHLVRRYRPDGTEFRALHVGRRAVAGGGGGLAFEVDATSGEILKPVIQAEPSDAYHADHHPTNHIIYREPVAETSPSTSDPTAGGVNGAAAAAPVKKKESFKEGVLQLGGSLTSALLRMIRKARKPIIVAGQGCNDCPDELRQFAERLQIPVCTTLHALGCFDERSPLALNMLGMHGHPTPNFLIQDADMVLSIGSRFDDRITGRMPDFVPEARRAAQEGRGGIVHVDIRLSENSKQIEPTYFIHSTGKNFLRTMNEALRQRDEKNAQVGKVDKIPTENWLKKMRELQRDYPVKIPEFPTEDVIVENENGVKITVPRTRMSAQSVISEINRQLLTAGVMDDAIFTTGVGVHQMVAAQLITWTKPRQMLSSGSLGTMGVALGYAIGAKLANGDRIVIAIDGDGSFNMTFTELKTLMEQGNIPIKIIILDNDGQMMVEYWQRLFHDNRLLAVRNSHNPDYVKLAGAFGIKALYCDHQEDLEEKMREFLFADPDQPVLFHARVERTPCLPLVAPGQPLQDMILEDVEVDVDGAAAPS